MLHSLLFRAPVCGPLVLLLALNERPDSWFCDCKLEQGRLRLEQAWTRSAFDIYRLSRARQVDVIYISGTMLLALRGRGHGEN